MATKASIIRDLKRRRAEIQQMLKSIDAGERHFVGVPHSKPTDVTAKRRALYVKLETLLSREIAYHDKTG